MSRSPRRPPFGRSRRRWMAVGVALAAAAVAAAAASVVVLVASSDSEGDGGVVAAPVGTPQSTVTPGAGSPTPTPGDGSPTPDPNAEVLRLVIPKIDVDSSSIITLSIESDGKTFQVPKNATQVGWYDFTAKPGTANGNAIFSAHVDYQGQKGVFFRLQEVDEGDEFYVFMADGTVYKYRATFARNIPKVNLSWEDIGCGSGYTGCATASDGSSLLTLITCGGSFDARRRSYRDNTVVRAELVEQTTADQVEF